VIRVLAYAASPVVLAGLLSMLDSDERLTIVGRSSQPSALAHDLEEAHADVAVLALERRDELPQPLVLSPDATPNAPALVVLVDEPAGAWVIDALRNGISAVLPRSATPDELLAAITSARAGLVVIPSEFVPTVLRPARAASGVATEPRAPLSPREIEILRHLADGLPNKIIAARLGISDHTVKTHVASILDKLGAGTRAEAVALGVRQGLILL
jgi:two-component system, NarL family, response regulator YdfI